MEHEIGDESGGIVTAFDEINGFKMENGGTLYVNICPVVGMKFQTEKGVYDMYQKYGRSKGLGKVRAAKYNGMDGEF